MSSLKAPRALARLFAPTASGVAAALVISLAVVAPAIAGTLQVTFDAYDNAPPGCEIWSTNGDSVFGMRSAVQRGCTRFLRRRRWLAARRRTSWDPDDRATGNCDQQRVCKPL